MRQSTKAKLISCVEQYREQFSDEYKLFIQQNTQRKKDVESVFGEVKGKLGLKRALFSVPETLHNIIVDKLDVGELTEFSEKTSALWFVKKFQEFSSVEKI